MIITEVFVSQKNLSFRRGSIPRRQDWRGFRIALLFGAMTALMPYLSPITAVSQSNDYALREIPAGVRYSNFLNDISFRGVINSANLVGGIISRTEGGRFPFLHYLSQRTSIFSEVPHDIKTPNILCDDISVLTSGVVNLSGGVFGTRQGYLNPQLCKQTWEIGFFYQNGKFLRFPTRIGPYNSDNPDHWIPKPWGLNEAGMLLLHGEGNGPNGPENGPNQSAACFAKTKTCLNIPPPAGCRCTEFDCSEWWAVDANNANTVLLRSDGTDAIYGQPSCNLSFTWTPEGGSKQLPLYQDLKVTPGGINDLGQILANVKINTRSRILLLDNNGQYKIVSGQQDSLSYNANDIGSRGEIVGSMAPTGSNIKSAFIYNRTGSGQFEDLNSLVAAPHEPFAEAWQVTNSGTILVMSRQGSDRKYKLYALLPKASTFRK